MLLNTANRKRALVSPARDGGGGGTNGGAGSEKGVECVCCTGSLEELVTWRSRP